MMRAAQIAKDIVTDPAFGFAVSGVLLFAQTSPVGLAATAFCAVTTAGIRVLRVIDPPYMRRDTWVTRILKDDRTPLRILGAAMIPVIGATIATTGIAVAATSAGALEFIAKGWQSVIVPVVTGGVFATADFMLAMQLSVAKQKEALPKLQSADVKIKPTKLQIVKTALSQPETYIAVGFMGIGLMAGPLSVLAFPFVIAGYARAMKNIISGEPDHKGHPKINYAIANMCFGVVGVLQGNYLAAIANFNNGPYMAVLESSLTPGGWRKVMQDIKGSIAKFFGKSGQPEDVIPFAAAPVEAPLLIDAAPTVKKDFEQAQQPVNIFLLAKAPPKNNPYNRT